MGVNVKAWRVILLAGFLFGCSEQGSQQTQTDNVDYAANAARWAREEFQPSTLSEAEQLAELAWFSEAAQGLRGSSINVVSETLTTHEYESTTLTQAFFDITGIRVTHDLIQEGDVIE